MVILTAFLRRTDFGVAVRAAAENGDRASLLGVPVRRVSTSVWIVAGGLAAAAAMLRAPVVGLVTGSTIIGPGLLLRGLAAAVIGRMENLHAAVVAALLLGVIEQSLFFGYSGSTVADAAFVAIMIGALLLQRRSRDRAAEGTTSTFVEIEEVKAVPTVLRHLPEVRALKVGLGAVVGASVVIFPLLVSDVRANLAAVIAIYAIVAISLVVLTGWGGQISLGHFALVGIGAAVCGRLVADARIDFIVALIGAAAAGAGVALVLGLASLRLRGFYFAVTSLGFAVATQTFFLNKKYFAALLPQHRPERPILLSRFDLAGETAYYYFCVAVLIAVVLGVRSLRRSRTGRVLIATRDNERAAQSYGVSPIRTRLLCFTISGAIAGLAGGLFAVHQHDVSPAAFLPNESLLVFSMVVIGGLGSVPGAILGALFVRGSSVLFPAEWAVLTSGAGLLVVLLVLPGGFGQVLFRARDRALRRIAERRGVIVPSLIADVRTTTPAEDDAAAELAYEAGRARAAQLTRVDA
jgi:branched-chain amino acid transport system permease protein